MAKPVIPFASQFIWPAPADGGHKTLDDLTAAGRAEMDILLGHTPGPTTYRLHRSDTRNIALQRRTPAGWKTLAYCGNSPRGIVRAVSELATAEWTPGDDRDLTQQLADLTHAIDQLEAVIVKLIEKAI